MPGWLKVKVHLDYQMFTSSLIFGLGSVTSLHMQKCIQPCTWLSDNMSFLKSVRMVTNHDGTARNIVQPSFQGVRTVVISNAELMLQGHNALCNSHVIISIP